MSLLVKLQAFLTKKNTPSRVFFTFLKLYKWYQIAQHITRKLTASDKLFSIHCSNKRICCVSNTLKPVNPFLTTQTKTYVSVFRLSQNDILKGAVFKLLPFIQNI